MCVCVCVYVCMCACMYVFDLIFGKNSRRTAMIINPDYNKFAFRRDN